VCGSTKGIGKAIAIQLAAMGCSVTLFARNQEALERTLLELNRARGQHHDYLMADFNQIAETQAVIENYTLKYKSIHILVNNSGGPPPGAISDAAIKDFEVAFTRHVLCNQAITAAVLPAMKNAQYGRIINVISTSVKTPIPGLGVSNTIRGAVASWAKTLSGEVARYGITVNNILPGFTDTDRLNDLLKRKADEAGMSLNELRQQMEESIPARRFADPAEPAALAGFLASPAAAYITGTSIRVDGGNTPSI
jgi:3-oxoacyl-[acyl-carrier protein] reductase